MRNRFILFLAVILILVLTGCGGPPRPKPGFYVGTNPDVSFTLSKKEYLDYINEPPYRFSDFIVVIPPIVVGDNSYPRRENSTELYYQETYRDGSFRYGNGGSASITINIDGNTISGHYIRSDAYVRFTFNGVYIDQYKLENPVVYEVDWSVKLSETLPTPLPSPTSNPTPAPPKLGHYQGTVGGFYGIYEGDVTFIITASGVEKFGFSNPKNNPLCGYAFGPDMVMKIGLNGSFTNGDKGDQIMNGYISGDTVYGTYRFPDHCSADCDKEGFCYYSPGAEPGGSFNAKWVSP
jgi:hypothetical protein